MGQIVTVEFRGDTLMAVEDGNGIHVVMRPLVEAMGLQWAAQSKRLSRDAVLSKGVSMMDIPSAGGSQQMACLKLAMLNGWLFKIEPNRIRDDETRARVRRYQEECYDALAAHFLGRQKPNRPEPRPLPDDIGELPSWSEARSLVCETRQTFNKLSARQMWFKLGLPVVPAMYEVQHQGELFGLRVIDGEKPPDPPEASQ